MMHRLLATFRRRPSLRSWLSAAALLAVVPAQADWVATNTKALVPKAGIATAPVAADLPLHVMVSLQYRNRAELEGFLKDQARPGSPSYGVALTPAQFAQEYAPATTDVAAVKTYLAANGFTNIVVSPTSKIVSADGTATMAQKAFNTTIAQFVLDGKTVHAPQVDLQVPSALGSIVQSVLGLQDAVVAHTDMARTNQATGDPTTATIAPAFTALAIRGAYDESTTPQGSGTTVGIVSAGDDLSVVREDLMQSSRVNHLPYVPTDVEQVAPLPSPQDTSGDGEWDLDGQSSTGIAGSVKHLIYFNTADTGDSLVMSFDGFAANPEAKALNVSLGGCEILDDLTGGLTADDDAFMQADAEGKTVFVSSGDAGAACSVAANLVTPDSGVVGVVEYPGSSPYVVCVGGTSLYLDANHNYVMEMSWAAGGGGVSFGETAPSWQAPAGVATSEAGFRSTPDIAMVAGLDVSVMVESPVFASAFYTYSGGLLYRSIGTSLSSPLSMGVWSRMESARCDGLGFAAPLIYALDTAGGVGSTANGFTDITTGTNGLYVATPGWDNTTGFGSWDIAAANGALQPMTCAANVAPTAVLTADTLGGAPPLAVTIDASKSSDGDGDALTYYVMDYDDSTPVVIQTTPAFAPHTYAEPGVYNANLSVRDARGGISSTVTKPVTVTGVPPTCAIPGTQIITAASGTSGIEGEDPYTGQDDLLAASVAEPGDMPGEIVFTIKVANLASLPAGLHWILYFTKSTDLYFDNFYFVQMSSADGTTATFNYGTRSFTPGNGFRVLNVTGSLNAASNYTADGTITLVLDKSALSLATGDILENLAIYTAIGGADSVAGVGVPSPAAQNLDLGGTFFGYRLVGNDCSAITYTPPLVAPTAALAATPVSGTAPLAVSFDASTSATPNAGATITSYTFTFGDGTSVTQTTPTVMHTYTAAGTYTATVAVSDSDGEASTNVAQQVITATTAAATLSTPVASLAATPTSGTSPLAVAFDGSASTTTNAGATITTYTFNFGDGSPVVTQMSPMVNHTYTSNGSYAATLMVTDSDNEASTNSAQQDIVVSSPASPTLVAPTASLSAAPTSGTAPISVFFDGSASSTTNSGATVTSYTFDFGDGSAPVTQSTATVSHTYTSPGSYTATLMVTDSAGQTSNNAAQQNITITAPPPATAPTASLAATPTSGNMPLAVAFDGSASTTPNSGATITSYTFNFGDGSAAVTQMTATVSHTYTAEGSYTATLSVTDSDGETSTNSATQNISVSSPSQTLVAPTAALSASPSSGAAPLTVTLNGSASTTPNSGATITSYNFNFGDGSAAVAQASNTVTHAYTTPGTYTATLSVTDSDGEASTNAAQQTITITNGTSTTAAPMAALSVTPATGTGPLQVTLIGSASTTPNPGASITSYTFSFGDGSAPVTQSSATVAHIYSDVGSYTATLTVSDSTGATSSNAADQQVVVIPVAENAPRKRGTGGALGLDVLAGLGLLAGLRRRRRRPMAGSQG